MLGEDAGEALIQAEHELDGALHIRSRALGTAAHLVNHHVGVRQAETLALGAGGQQHRGHAGSNADAVGVDIAGDELHGVVNSQTCGYGTTGGVDVDVDILLRVGHLQEEKLCNHRIGHSVIDFRANEDDSVEQQTGVDVIGALALAGLLNDGRNVVVLGGVHNVLLTHFIIRTAAGKG